MSYVGNYTYKAETEIDPGSVAYKIADEDWSAPTDFGGPYTEAGLSVGPGTANLIDTVGLAPQTFYFFSMPDGAGGTLNFHQLAPAAPANNPYGVPVFLRGSFNDWGLDVRMSYDEAGQTFSASLTLDATDYPFKIASEDWSTVDFGGETPDDPVTPGVPKTLVRSSNNLLLSLDAAGDYDFSVDVTAPEAPIVTVTPAP